MNITSLQFSANINQKSLNLKNEKQPNSQVVEKQNCNSVPNICYTANSITKYNNICNFKSKINPIKPYKMNTILGEISISEINIDKEATPNLMHKINKFFCENFSRDTVDTTYTIYQTLSSEEKKLFEEGFLRYIMHTLTNTRLKDYVTLLVAKDKNNCIQGACLSAPNFYVPDSIDTTLVIDLMAVNPAYRNIHIAQELLTKTLDVNKNSFTDVFLTGTTFARKFYEKMGFKVLDKTQLAQKAIFDYMQARRHDIPEHVLPMTKVIQKDSPRWYDKMYKTNR